MGGSLATISGTASTYLTFFYTWPTEEEWWTSGTSGGLCRTWDEASFTDGLADCTSTLRSICRLP
jgi:hypothetical protein